MRPALAAAIVRRVLALDARIARIDCAICDEIAQTTALAADSLRLAERIDLLSLRVESLSAEVRSLSAKYLIEAQTNEALREALATYVSLESAGRDS